jgi:RNA polymerase sigma factor (TIGR02999 family)
VGQTSAQATVTSLLIELRQGVPGALDRLIPVVYDELRRIAAGYLHNDRSTLEPTVLVHELYLRLVDLREADFTTRRHFYATAALLMRRLIIDHARAALAAKRGGGQVVTLDPDVALGSQTPEEILRLNDALTRLGEIDPRQSSVVEMRFFGGFTLELVAEMLGVSLATVKRDWAMARAWLATELAS